MKTRIAKASLCTVLSLALILSGCSTSWISTALADLPVITQVALNIASIVAAAQGKGQTSPAVTGEVQSIANQVQSDLTLVQSLISSYQSASAAAKPGIVQKIAAALAGVQSNLNAILTAVHVNDAALQATITAAVGVAVSTVASIAALLPAAPVPAAASTAPASSASATSARAAKSTPALKPPSASQLKREFNAIFASNGFPQAEIK
jgi:hypothetical protein